MYNCKTFKQINQGDFRSINRLILKESELVFAVKVSFVDIIYSAIVYDRVLNLGAFFFFLFPLKLVQNVNKTKVYRRV